MRQGMQRALQNYEMKKKKTQKSNICVLEVLEGGKK